MTAYELTLAQGSGSGTGLPIGQFVVYAILGVIFVSTLIKNAITEAKKKKRREANRAGNAGGAGNSGGRPSLDEIAARRRAQLQDMARQRSGGGATRGQAGGPAGAGVPGGIPGGDDMANLSMAERIARARASQQGRTPTQGQAPAPARRSTPLPSERPGPSTPRTPQPTRDPQQQRAEVLRERMRRQEQQRREALAQRQRQQQQARAQQAQRSRQQTKPAPRPTPAPKPKEVRRTVEDASELEVGSARRQREVAASSGGASALIDFRKLSRKDLQRAFILKEILDRPVAERDPLADVNSG